MKRMNMSRTLCFLFLLILNSLQNCTADFDSIINLYSRRKVMSSCFGSSYKQHQLKMLMAVRECADPPSRAKSIRTVTQFPQESVTPIGPFGPIGGPGGSASAAPVYNPMWNAFNWQKFFNTQAPGASEGPSANTLNTMPMFAGVSGTPFLLSLGRKKRDTGNKLFDSARINILTERVVNTIANFTCILRKINYLNEADILQFDYMVNETHQYKLDKTLQKDLVDGINHCKDLTACLPFEMMHSAYPTAIKRIMSFMECENRNRIISCMKYDLRKDRDSFDLTELDGLMSDMREDEKMLTVVWSDLYYELGKPTDLLYKKK